MLPILPAPGSKLFLLPMNALRPSERSQGKPKFVAGGTTLYFVKEFLGRLLVAHKSLKSKGKFLHRQSLVMPSRFSLLSLLLSVSPSSLIARFLGRFLWVQVASTFRLVQKPWSLVSNGKHQALSLGPSLKESTQLGDHTLVGQAWNGARGQPH